MRAIATKMTCFTTIETFNFAFEFVDIHRSTSTRSYSMTRSFGLCRRMDIGDESMRDARGSSVRRRLSRSILRIVSLLKTSQSQEFVLPFVVGGRKRILEIDISKEISMNTILKKSNLLVRVGEFGVIEILLEVGDVFIDTLSTLLVMFEPFPSLLLGDLVLEMLIEFALEISPRAKVIPS